eukprot:2248911-Rhodomonas_salina.3
MFKRMSSNRLGLRTARFTEARVTKTKRAATREKQRIAGTGQEAAGWRGDKTFKPTQRSSYTRLKDRQKVRPAGLRGSGGRGCAGDDLRRCRGRCRGWEARARTPDAWLRSKRNRVSIVSSLLLLVGVVVLLLVVLSDSTDRCHQADSTPIFCQETPKVDTCSRYEDQQTASHQIIVQSNVNAGHPTTITENNHDVVIQRKHADKTRMKIIGTSLNLVERAAELCLTRLIRPLYCLRPPISLSESASSGFRV